MVARAVEEQFRRLLETTTTTEAVTERVTEIFDTTQPTDSTTGTPPLLSRITEKSEASSRSESREQSEAKATGSETQTEASTATHSRDTAIDQEAESKEAGETERHEERCEPWWIAVLEIVGSIAAGGFLLWLLCLVGRAIKQFSNNH